MAVVRDYVVNLPHNYYLAIGEFMFRIGQLETQLHELLWRVTDIDNRKGRVLTIGADIKAIRGMLRTAVSDAMRGMWIPKEKRDFAQRIGVILNKAKEFFELRNKLAHGSWQSPIGNYSDAQLLFMRESNEKYLARVDPKIDDAYLHTECMKLKALNIKTHELIIDISAFRGIDSSNFHSRKYLR